MGLLGTTLIFEPPNWPTLLLSAAIIGLVLEILAMSRSARRLGSLTHSIVWMVLALLAGPILMLAAGFYAVATASTEQRLSGRGLVGLGFRGSAVAGLGWLAWSWPTGGSILAIAAIGGLWAIRGYRKTTSPISGRTRRILLLTRLLVLAIAAIWALWPVWQHVRYKTVRAVLLVGMDRSASMTRRDMPEDPFVLPGQEDTDKTVSRIEALRRALAKSRTKIEGIREQVEIKFFAFDEGVVADAWLEPSEGTSPQSLLNGNPGPRTAIGDSTQAALLPVTSQGFRVAAVLLMTDGQSNSDDAITPDTLAARLGSQSVPVYTVAVGASRATAHTRALTVRKVGVAETVPAFQRMSIKPTIDAVGLAGRTVAVTAWFGDEEVGSNTRDIRHDQQVEQFTFHHVPLDAGFHRVRVEAKVLGEPVRDLAGRPAADALVQVTDREIRVLYVEGRYRYEVAYITRALAGFDRVTLDRRILLQPLRQGQAPAFGNTLADWLRYHAIIFGDVSPKHFTPQQLEFIRQVVVEYGKGFAMIGGARHSFGAGTWQDTPIAAILPVDAARSVGQIEKPVRPGPTPESRNHELLQIGPPGSDPAQVWGELDALPGANRLGGVKPIATVLLASEDGDPLMVSQRVGKGRSLAIAFDTTWRWALSPKDTAAAQQRFWRQVALYLAAPRGNLWVHSNRTTYDMRALETGQQKIEITAGSENAQGEPLADTDIRVQIVNPKGVSAPVELRKDGQIRVGRITRHPDEGVYALVAEADVEGRPMRVEHKFEIIRRDLESLEVLANTKRLKQMAESSKGQSAMLADLPGLLDDLKVVTRPEQESVLEPEPVLERVRWPLISFLVFLLCVEWVIRKRKGLI